MGHKYLRQIAITHTYNLAVDSKKFEPNISVSTGGGVGQQTNIGKQCPQSPNVLDRPVILSIESLINKLN